MCMFSFKNSSSPRALMKGVECFECGGCPECLQKKSRQWALRCGMEARTVYTFPDGSRCRQVGMMITLTYDTYKNGKDGEENPVDPTLSLSKAHVQRFFKRLRKKFENNPLPIRYLCTAERGKRTHRAHYHALVFGIKFDDLRFYKKSSRGNPIYKSRTLEKIWSADREHNGGICTVDCINVNAATARYCTKYCTKDSGVDDTFMLFSRGIGEHELLKRFNGLSYWVDGREYSIPRIIWNKVIERKYNIQGYSRYVNEVHRFNFEKMLYSKLLKADEYEALGLYKRYDRVMGYDFLKAHDRQSVRREIFCSYRDNDFLYKRYLAYWKAKNDVIQLTRPSDVDRIISLPNDKYRAYKNKALRAKQSILDKFDVVPPRSNCHAFCRIKPEKERDEKSFAPFSRHYRANDTTSKKYKPSKPLLEEIETDFDPFPYSEIRKKVN